MQHRQTTFLNKRFLRAAGLAALLALTIITQTACAGTSADAADPVSSDDYLLDTVCTISIYEMTDEEGKVQPAQDMKEQALAAEDEAFSLCAALDKKLSRTQEASEVSRINSAGGEWTEVSDDTLQLIREGVRYSELSGGDFDITIGAVTSLWDFHADEEDAVVPDADVLAEAVTHVGYDTIEIDGSRVRLTDPDAKIDLGGIAKGYVGDRMAESLEDAGVTSGIVNLGGNVICIGSKPGSEGFVIGVEAPFSDHSEIVGKISSADMTLVTSGVYERKIVVDGRMYHHILDPKTGYSAETDLDAVTLTAAKGHSMDCDAMSTICLIKGYEAARELIENTDGIEAVFILSDGTIEQTAGAGFTRE